MSLLIATSIVLFCLHVLLEGVLKYFGSKYDLLKNAMSNVSDIYGGWFAQRIVFFIGVSLLNTNKNAFLNSLLTVQSR